MSRVWGKFQENLKGLRCGKCKTIPKLPLGGPDDFVFTYKGAPFKAEVVRRAWREVAKKVGIDANCYQGTRHSIASQAINCGIPLEVIGGMLGHKTRSSTTRYAHLNNEALNQNAQPKF